MEMYQGSSTQQPAAICALKSPVDAIHILEAVRLGIVPRVTRRLTGHERAMIRPGTVWVWEEEETNMRRWTDGRRWGASRVGGGGFLVYTESSESLSPPPSRSDSPYGQHSGYYPGPGSSSSSSSRRPESLIKQTYSTTMTHPVTGKLKKFHVVAYSSKHNPQGDVHNPLPLPHQLPALSSLRVTPGIWPEWEHRREQEYGNSGRRPPSASGLPASSSSSTFGPPSQSAPATAVSSPNGPPYSVAVPPTAYPAQRPPSPQGYGGGRSFQPPPPPYPRSGTAFEGRSSPSLPPPSSHQQQQQQGNLRGPSAPYQHPPPLVNTRRDQYDTSMGPGFPGRQMTAPPHMFPSNPVPGTERFHPYSMVSRNPNSNPNHNRVTSYPPSTGSSGIPTTPIGSGQSSHHGDTSQSRASPSSQSYPFAYSRPSSSGGRSYQETKPFQQGDRDRLSPETKFRSSINDNNNGNSDPRRYPSDNNGGHLRQISNSSSSRLDTSPNQSNRLQPPISSNDLASASGRSPKMSISSTLLNHNASNPSNPAPGLTLPPLRTTLDGNTGGNRQENILPSPGHISPRIVSQTSANPNQRASNSPSHDIKKDWSGGEDARQLGELGRRVVL
ncbi:uncharacterized protein IL334_006274 [Kwoniella shivajii]|uniref:cAMP-independent regulatory protein pac2 n=1 Tax=Kwoniella shivajii TaxID=564305 RepID=A0ABZ1D7D6_9TREE|nr:hypothetical protein IL334_006274 [Kwoniella shivajii]